MLHFFCLFPKQIVNLECPTYSCTLLCSQSTATTHIGMFSRMEKAIFYSAIFIQYGYSGKLKKLNNSLLS